MDASPSRVSGEPVASVVDKGWNLISHNTELLFFIALGFIELVVEAAGYKPFFLLNDLLPVLPRPSPDLPSDHADTTTQTLPDLADNSSQTGETLPAYLEDFPLVNKISDIMDLVGAYTVHVTIAAHLLLPYPVLTERQKMLLVPWLFVTFFRSVLKELVFSFVGILICASHDVLYLPCLQYSAMQGAQFCFVFYVWSSVHTFYHFLNRTKTAEERDNSVINAIKRNSASLPHSPSASIRETVSHVLATNMDEEDDLEAALVERAAMAWIAREIVECDSESISDQQLSQYLAVKATMELRQALAELAEKRRRRRRRKKSLSTKQRVAETLEYCRLAGRERANSRESLRSEAFDTHFSLSRRDPIRYIRPLTSHGKPVSSKFSISTRDSIFSNDTMSVKSVDTASQTDPPTYKMSKLLDILEFHQQQRAKLSMQREEEIKKDFFLNPIDSDTNIEPEFN